MQELIVATDNRVDNLPAIPPVIAELVEVPPAAVVVHVDPKVLAWLSHRGVVVAILLVAGPLGLPALWFSPRFSKTTKIVVSLALFAATVVAPLAVSWYWLDVAVRPVLDALSATRG